MNERKLAELVTAGKRFLVRIGDQKFTITAVSNTDGYTVIHKEEATQLTDHPGCMNRYTARKILFYL